MKAQNLIKLIQQHRSYLPVISNALSSAFLLPIIITLSFLYIFDLHDKAMADRQLFFKAPWTSIMVKNRR